MSGIEVATWGNLVIEIAILYVLIEEYYFDKKIFEQKRRRIKRTKNKVHIEIDKEGNASISEKPNEVDVTISHKDS